MNLKQEKGSHGNKNTLKIKSIPDSLKAIGYGLGETEWFLTNSTGSDF